MQIIAWAHGQTFAPPWQETELRWIDSYQVACQERGFAFERLGPLAPKFSPTSVLHVFGAEHWESWHWLAPQAREFWASPFPFTFEPKTRTPRPGGRFAWGRTARRNRAALDLPHRFIAPAYAEPILRGWGIPSRKITIASSPDFPWP